MKKFGRIYIEITNICNLSCSFCHGTKREKQMMTPETFRFYLERIKGYTDLIFLHVMGEPLIHPQLNELLEIAEEYGFRTVITTNGTLLAGKADILRNAGVLYRVNISLHSFANESKQSMNEYLSNCIAYAKNPGNAKVCFRLWNGGVQETFNDEIQAFLHTAFPDKWQKNRKGFSLCENVFIEYADRFDWPDIEGEFTGEDVFCYGLRDQLGILCDGTVIPCCLDCEGEISLGNLNDNTLDEILSNDRATAIYDGFSRRKAVENLCKRCKVSQHLN